MIPKKIYLTKQELQDTITCERMVSIDEPYRDMTEEYTNLSQVWHDVNEEPQENSKIVIVDTKGEWWNIDYISDDFDGSGLYGWEFCIAHYNLKLWAYISDLLPKGGEK